MSDPVAAKQGPRCVELKAGRTYFWCSCGVSKRHPFCDGSHAGTQFTPLKFTAQEDGAAVLCGCKGTGTSPFCDCTHAQPFATYEAAGGKSCRGLPGCSDHVKNSIV
jgi:CDGSH-type Zn-finger protein